MAEGQMRAGEVPTPSSPQLSTPNSQPAIAPFPGESNRAFAAFRAYLELGPQRRYLAVARKVGASLRTIKRWALDYDWRGRIKAHAAQGAEEYDATVAAAQREEGQEAVVREQAFHERQDALAEALLDVAESYLERLGEADPDEMSFADACKAVEVASRLKQQAQARAIDSASAPVRGLGDQLAALLDQACAAIPSSSQPGNPAPA